jgi:hypothetical protein
VAQFKTKQAQRVCPNQNAWEFEVRNDEFKKKKRMVKVGFC